MLCGRALMPRPSAPTAGAHIQRSRACVRRKRRPGRPLKGGGRRLRTRLSLSFLSFLSPFFGGGLLGVGEKELKIYLDGLLPGVLRAILDPLDDRASHGFAKDC